MKNREVKLCVRDCDKVHIHSDGEPYCRPLAAHLTPDSKPLEHCLTITKRQGRYESRAQLRKGRSIPKAVMLPGAKKPGLLEY
jgi:hypothetical protein